MTKTEMFLSVIIVAKDQAFELKEIISEMTATLAGTVSDYEIIIVDNASTDDSLLLLKEMTQRGGFPNLQVFALTKEVESDIATWVGLEGSIGDFTVVIDPAEDSISFLPSMLEAAISGHEVVFACNMQKPNQRYFRAMIYSILKKLYIWCTGIDLEKEAPKFRLLSRSVINYILQFNQPSLIYRQLPATSGFPKKVLSYSHEPKVTRKKSLVSSIDRGTRLLVSSTRAPMRLVTWICLFGAGSNLLYSLYVLAIAFLKSDVAPGWISLSLQQSGMFFLISLVLLVIGEYVLHTAYLSNEGPLYHVAQEFSSEKILHKEKLNIEVLNRNSDSLARQKNVIQR